MTAIGAVWARSRDEPRSATGRRPVRRGRPGVRSRPARGVPLLLGAAHRHRPRGGCRCSPDLRAAGTRVGVLSNTLWPREWHEEFFRRDGVLDLLDGAVYTSEVAWTKPAPEAFQAVMAAVGVSDPARCVFVGDRLFDDVWGARNAGMRTIHVPHSTIPRRAGGSLRGQPRRRRATGYPRSRPCSRTGEAPGATSARSCSADLGIAFMVCRCAGWVTVSQWVLSSTDCPGPAVPGKISGPSS